MGDNMINPINKIEDWEERIKRQDAFFQGEIIDRPCVLIPIYHSGENEPCNDYKERWFNVDYQVTQALKYVERTEFYGDALPIVFPNLGPEVFSAFFGCELEYGETTSWAVPMIENWENDFHKIEFSEDNEYYKKINELTDAYLSAGKGLFYTGITDLHTGGDGVCAFRDPVNMNMDLIDEPESIVKTLDKITEVYYKVFDYFYNKLVEKGQPCSTWNNTATSKRFYVPSNDFSCMISNKMFRKFFLEGIREECKFYENSIYHLDGPNALRHLDDILEIEELNAVQWIPGAGHDIYSDDFNLPILQKIQKAGKGLQFYINTWEIDTIMKNLKPNGVHLTINGVSDKKEAEEILKYIENWK